MIKKNVFILVVMALLLTSCSSTYYYQVFKVTPAAPINKEDGMLVFEDENCRVSYNLWQKDGNIGFVFTNKTSENIYLDLTECFYILNGIAYDYYKERMFGSVSSQSGASVSTNRTTIGVQSNTSTSASVWASLLGSSTRGSVVSESSSITVNERKVICIPSETSKIINEYNITDAIYRDCDLFRYPKKNQIKSKFFTKEDSPVHFSNRLAYYVGDSEVLVRIENAFHVSEISNHPEKDVIEITFNEYCGETNRAKSTVSYFKNSAPDSFYIIYTTNLNGLKH